MSKHIFSENLLEEERKKCVSSLREKNTILAMAIVKFFRTNPPDHSEWEEMGAGALMFIKDSAVRSFFIKFLPLTIAGKSFEQEVYKQMKLLQLAECFISFEGEECVIGIMFSFKEEYDEFYKKLNKNISRKSEKTPEAAAKDSNAQSKANKKTTFLGKFKDKKKKPLPTKLSISGPSDFRQVAHVGAEGLTVFDEQGDKEKWTKLASMLLGGDPDEKTSKEMIDFVNQNGGIDKFVKAAEKKSKKLHNKSPKEAPVKKPRHSPSEDHKSSKNSSAPPPPPPPCGPPAPPPPSGPPPMGSSVVAKSSDASISPNVPKNDRGCLLSQIQQGRVLKKVEVTENSSDSDEDAEGILGALAQNLANFRQRMNIGDDSGDESEEEDWSD